MRLRTPFLGFLGLMVLGLVAVQLVKGDLSITDAALRVGVVAGALVAVERFLLPIAAALVSSSRRRED
ncbi:MAG: hypothetical protein WCD35_07245 [Mycobacteriales bacterium]